MPIRTKLGQSQVVPHGSHGQAWVCRGERFPCASPHWLEGAPGFMDFTVSSLPASPPRLHALREVPVRRAALRYT